MESTRIFALIVLIICVRNVRCGPLTDGDGVEQDDLNGEVLEKLGEKLNLPTLQMMGWAIENVERTIEQKICDLHRCSSWTEWQGCNARPGQIGSTFRTRQCGMNATTCDFDSSSKQEKESTLCNGFCPKGYNVTKNGYCLKIYADQSGNYDAAEQRCKKDNSHLIIIDSEVKSEDVNNMLQGSGYVVWVDGRRKDASSPWQYKYGSQKGFFKWCSSCPSNNPNELCLYLHVTSTYMYMDDASCSNSYLSLCEISN